MSLGETARLHIRTPEGVVFSLPLASPILRGLATFVDLAAMLAMTYLSWWLAHQLSVVILETSNATQILLQFHVWIFYPMITEWLWDGQTLGKRVFGLRVMDERGLALRPGQIILRNLMRTVDSLPLFLYLVGGVAAVVSRRCQRLGDLVAGTIVVRTIHSPQPDVDKLLGQELNPFRSFPHLEARLRQNASPDEARIALEALQRRDHFEPGHRLRLFSALASRFREMVEFPADSTAGMSDEQYVRNIVDTLFRHRTMA